MTAHQPITPAELATLKTFWSAEDERNGGMSDTSRCIAEIERLQAALEKIRTYDVPFELDNTLFFDCREQAAQALFPSQP